MSQNENRIIAQVHHGDGSTFAGSILGFDAASVLGRGVGMIVYQEGNDAEVMHMQETANGGSLLRDVSIRGNRIQVSSAEHLGSSGGRIDHGTTIESAAVAGAARSAISRAMANGSLNAREVDQLDKLRQDISMAAMNGGGFDDDETRRIIARANRIAPEVRR